jgi:hypothetical protein
VLQTRVFANQLSATVWPYLSFNLYQSDKGVRYTLGNQGLGPAIVHSATLTLDGKSSDSFKAATGILLHGNFKGSTISSTSLESGDVLRPGASLEIVAYTGPLARTLTLTAIRRMTVTICYCSLLEQCWTLTSLQSSSGPARVSNCPEGGSVKA